MTTARRVATVVVTLHVLVHAAHGVVHETIPVRIAAWQTAFVVGVILLLPLLGLALLLSGRRRLAAGTLVGSGVAALGFELAYHFLLENPDHVHAVADGAVSFVGTAILTALADVALLLVGAWLYRRSS